MLHQREDEKVSNLRLEDTDEMVSWRSLSYEEIDKCLMEMAENSG